MENKRQQMIVLYQNGTALEQISKILSISRSTIARWRNKMDETIQINRAKTKLLIQNEKNQQIIDLISNGKSVHQVAKVLRVSKGRVRSLVKTSNIHIKANNTYLNQSQKLKLIEDFISGMFSIVDLQKKYNTTNKTIYNILNRNNIKYRNNRQYKINQSYFQIIDTPVKAYWLGFLCADGNVSRYKNSSQNFSMGLSTRDRRTLQLLKQDLGYQGKINDYTQYSKKYKKAYHLSKLTIGSKKSCQNLVLNGCVLNKTNDLKFTKINRELIKFWILGFFDGDGCISFNNKNQKKANWNIVGTHDVCIGIYEYLKQTIGVEATIIHKKGILYKVATSKRQYIKRIAQHLYVNEDVNFRVLNRKKSKMQIVTELNPSYKGNKK